MNSITPAAPAHGPLTLFLLIGGGDNFSADIVTRDELDEKFIALHYEPASSCPPDERAAMLEHLHDEDNWERNFGLGPTRYHQSYEDGFVDVCLLPGFISERMASYRTVRAIEEERWRQVHHEGWTAQHDDKHDPGELASAGACYALHAGCVLYPHDGVGFDGPPEFWLWDRTWWKPKNPRRDLIRAAALIAAELDKLDRSSTLPNQEKA